MTKRFVFIVVTLLLLINGAVSADEPAPLRVGVVLSLTGPANVWGSNARLGLELARDEINAGKVAGRQIELVIEDSKSQPASAVSAFRKLVEVDKVQIVVGDVWAIFTNPLISLADRAKVILIPPTVMDASIKGSSEYFFTLGHRVATLRKPTEKFLDLNPHIKRVAIMCWEDDWGMAHLQMWKELLSRRTIEVIDESCQGDFTYDYRAEVTRLARKKPDALIISYRIDVIARRLNEQNFHPLILTTSAIVEPLAMGEMPIELVEGVYFTEWVPGEKFRSSFKTRFGKEPLVEAHNSYDALYSVAKASAHRAEGEELLNALKRVSFQSETGLIDFSKAPNVNLGEATLRRVQAGKMITVP